ncbi:MAG: histidine phosphatase family protein [Clostridia bacterium]|nr:histidine phosphatase family protein [Clostridia bacterium]
MTRIILIRHGQSEANKARIFAGHTDAPLSEKGRAQAQAAATYLLAHEHIDAVYASDLSRAMSTARPTAEAFGLPIHPEPALREIFAGAWEGRYFDDLDVEYPTDRERWRCDLANAFCTKGETIASVFERSLAAVTRIARENEGKTVLIAAHWTPVLAMVCSAEGYGVEHIGSCTEPKNASLSILRFENGVFTPERLNITEHLGDLAERAHL